LSENLTVSFYQVKDPKVLLNTLSLNRLMVILTFSAQLKLEFTNESLQFKLF